MGSEENEEMAGKKKRKLRTQFVKCERLCRPLPEVKRVMKRLSSTRKFCKDYEWKRRPFIPPGSRRAGDVRSCRAEKDPVIVDAGEESDTQSKENVAQKIASDADEEGENVAEESNINSNTKSKEGECVAEKSGADSDTPKEEQHVGERSSVHPDIESQEWEHVEEKAEGANIDMIDKESTRDSNFKLSCSCEIIETLTNSGEERRKRVREILGQLGLDSVILEAAQDPKKPDVLLPHILEGSGSKESGKAETTAGENQCSNTQQLQRTKKRKTSDKDALKDKLGELNAAKPPRVTKGKVTKKCVSSNIPGLRKLERFKASDKEFCSRIVEKIARPPRIKRHKTMMSFDVTDHIEGKPITAEPQEQEVQLETHDNSNEDASNNTQENSSIALRRKQRRIKAVDKYMPEDIRTRKPQLSGKRRGRKSKAALLLEQMVQCYNALQGSSSDSHRHIAELLSMEIEKAKEDNKTVAPSEASHGLSAGASIVPSEAAEAGIEDQEDLESQVLEVEATFLVKASSGGGQEIEGMSLVPPKLHCSGVEVSGKLEERSTNGGLSETLENSDNLLTPNLTSYYASLKPFLSFPASLVSDDSISPGKPESSVPQNIPSDSKPTQSRRVHPYLHYTPSEYIQPVSHPPLQSHTPLPCMMPNLTQGLSCDADTHTDPHHSLPSCSTQQQTPPPVTPHNTQPELNVCPSDHTGTKLHVPALQDSPLEGHSSVLNDTPSRPEVDGEGSQEQPLFSPPRPSQVGSFPSIPHHTHTERLSSQSEPCYPVCSSPKKKTKNSPKFMSNYNLRSKSLNNDVSETNKVTSLLKKHCRTEPRIYLRKVEYDPSFVMIKNENAESQRSSPPIAKGMSLPVSIPFAVLALPSGQRNVVEVLEKAVDSQEEKCVQGRTQQSTNKSVGVKDESEEERHLYNTQGSTGDESGVGVMGVGGGGGGGGSNDEEAGYKESQGGIAAENLCYEMCGECSEEEPSVMQEVTDVENSQGETDEAGLVEGMSQNTLTSEVKQEETDVESLDGTLDGDSVNETPVHNSHETDHDQMTQEGSDAENYQERNIEGNYDEMCIENHQEAATIEVSQEGACEASAISRGESDNELQRIENSQASQVECHALGVSGGEQCEMVVVTMNREGGPGIGMYEAMAVNSGNSPEDTSVKGSQLVVMSGDSEEGRGQGYVEGSNSFILSLYTDGNSYSDLDNITLTPGKRSKFTQPDFDGRRSNLDQPTVSNDDDGVRDNGTAPLGEDSCCDTNEQPALSLNVEEGKDVNLAENDQCPPARDESSLCQKECGAAAALCDTSYSHTGDDTIATQCVHYSPNDMELLGDLEGHLDYTGRDRSVQGSFEAPTVTLKDTAVAETSPPQASSEEQGEPGQGSNSPHAPASPPHCDGHHTHSDHTSSSQDRKDGEVAGGGDSDGSGDPADSDGEDVVSLYTDYSLLDSDDSGEVNTYSQGDDLRVLKDTEEDNGEEYSSVSKSEGMAGDVNDSVLLDSSEHSHSGDRLEVGPGSDEALCGTDSDTESLRSKSSVIDRIIENEAKCSLEEERLESDALNSLPSADNDGETDEGEGTVEVFRDGQQVTPSHEVPPPEALQSDSCSRQSVAPTATPNNDASPHCSNPSQTLRNFIPLQTSKPGERRFEGQEEAYDKTITDDNPSPSSKFNEKTQPPPLPPPPPPPPSLPPPHRNQGFAMPRLQLPDNLGICFVFINRGICERQDCHFTHKITLECEQYLGQRILSLVTGGRQDEAWDLLGLHLSHHHNSLPLAISLLLPLAKHLVSLIHNKQPSSTRVPSFFTVPLDVAKVKVLCEERHGKAAFRLLCSCLPKAPLEARKTFIKIFVRFCENFSERQMLSPWEKVVLWGYDRCRRDSDAKLKELLNMEWLSLHMSSGNASMVLKAYSHLSQALTSPNMFFTHITCQVISYFIDAGKPQDSFRVLGEVRRLRDNSSAIFVALIPNKRESVHALVAELQELGRLVCELCVPLPANSWSLLLSHMMDIQDLSMTMALVQMQMNFMTPEINILKCLVAESLAKGPAMLQPLCSFVCQLPEEVLRPLEGSLNCLVNASTPQHIKSKIIQHCKKFGISLRPLVIDLPLMMEEQMEHYQCSRIGNNSNITISDYSSSNRSSNFDQRELQGHVLPSQYLAFHREMNPRPCLVENIGADGQCFQELRSDDTTSAVCEQSDLPMPPTPKSLPSSVRSELGSNQLLVVKQHSAQERCTVAPKVQQQQPPLIVDGSHQIPSKESPCNPRTQDKIFTDMRGKNTSHDLGSSLMSPDSTNISPNSRHSKIDNKEKSPAVNSKVTRKTAKSSGSRGSRSVQSLHAHCQKPYSQSVCKDSSGFNEMVSKTHPHIRRLKNSIIPQKSEDIPRFRTIKRDNFSLPKLPTRQDMREGEASNMEDLGVNHFPPCDEATPSGVGSNPDTAAPLKFPRVAERVMKMFSPTSAPVQNLQVSSQQDQRSLGHQQPTTSHQTERDNNSEKFSGCPGRSFPVQQKHWFPLEKDGRLNHMRSPVFISSPSSSVISDLYLHNSPPSWSSSSRMSLRNEFEEQEVESSEIESSVMRVHQIAAIESITEKKVMVAELAAALTGCSNIYSSGAKFDSIVKACNCRNVVLSPEVREVIGALGLLVMEECVRQKIFSEAELTIFSLQRHKLSSFNSLVSWEKGCSEHQLALKALQVLHHMRNYSLFIDILEDTSWSGGVEDVRARLQLLGEVLDVMHQSGKNTGSLWYTGRILASLVTYYHSDTVMLYNYHDFLDLPGHLEAAWQRVEALNVVGVLEQFTVIINTALRLHLPFSQHFIYHLMNSGIGVGSMEMAMAPQGSYSEPPLPLALPRECGSLKWNGKARRGRGSRAGNKRKGGFRGTYRGGRPRGYQRGHRQLNQLT